MYSYVDVTGKTKEYTQSGNGRFLAYIPSKNQPWLVRVGVHSPPPFTIFTITYKVSVDAPAERADTLPLFHLYPTCTLWVRPCSNIRRHLPLAKESGKLTRSTIVTKNDWRHRLSRQYKFMWKNINFLYIYICSSKRCLTVVGSATALHSFNPSRGSGRINRGFQMRWSAARGDCQKYSDYYAYRTRKNNIFYVKFMKSCFFPSKSFSLMQVNGISLTGMYHQEVVSTLKKVSTPNTYIPRVPQFLSLRPNWDPPPPLPQASVYLIRTKGGGTLTCGWGGGGPNWDDWRKSLASVYSEVTG